MAWCVDATLEVSCVTLRLRKSLSSKIKQKKGRHFLKSEFDGKCRREVGQRCFALGATTWCKSDAVISQYGHDVRSGKGPSGCAPNHFWTQRLPLLLLLPYLAHNKLRCLTWIIALGKNFSHLPPTFLPYYQRQLSSMICCWLLNAPSSNSLAR